MNKYSRISQQILFIIVILLFGNFLLVEAESRLIWDSNTDNYNKLPGDRLTLHYDNIVVQDNTIKIRKKVSDYVSMGFEEEVSNYRECKKNAFYFISFSSKNITLNPSPELDFYNYIIQSVDFDYQGTIMTMDFKCVLYRDEVIKYLTSQNINVGDIIPQNNIVIQICQNSIKNEYFNGNLDSSSNIPMDGLICFYNEEQNCYYQNKILVSECYYYFEYNLWLAFLILFPLFHSISLCCGGIFCFYLKRVNLYRENQYICGCYSNSKINEFH
jgi:hypothetical protein